jgi:hypothetical protein
VHDTRGQGKSARPPIVGEIDEILKLIILAGARHWPAVTWVAGPLCAALGARAGPRSSPRAAHGVRQRQRLSGAGLDAQGLGRALASFSRARVCRSARGGRSRRARGGAVPMSQSRARRQRLNWARTYDDFPPTIRRLSADYQNLIFRPLHQDDAVDSDKTS